LSNGAESVWRARPEAGSAFGIRFLELVGRLFGRRVLWWLLYPTALYFFLVRGAERRASTDYLKRVNGRKVSWTEGVRHFLCFARVTADRFLLMAGLGSNIDVRFHGVDEMHELVERGRGGLFLAAHFGSFEAARMIGHTHPDVNIRIVLDDQVNNNMMRRLAEANPAFSSSIISPHQSAASLGVEIAAAMHEGDWVGFLADRQFGGERTLRGELLGSIVEIPAGAFMVAAAFRAPVIAVFPVLRGRRYDVYFEVLSEGFNAPRADREAALSSMAARYLQRLEHHMRSAPYNWFNFYDFWKMPDA